MLKLIARDIDEPLPLSSEILQGTIVVCKCNPTLNNILLTNELQRKGRNWPVTQNLQTVEQHYSADNQQLQFDLMPIETLPALFRV